VFEQVVIRASDRQASERFYEIVLATLGLTVTERGADLTAWNDFCVAQADDSARTTRRLHIGFIAPSPAAVDAFWHAGVEAGYSDDGPPGPRPQYSDDYYGAFLLDPDGNSAEAVSHGNLRRGGAIDHLWVRIPDVAAARRSYEAVGPGADLRIVHDAADRLRISNGNGSFTLIAGPPTENADVTFL
jgi:catechol 2,3-dioxygenase-like lactoylglutathione lyase family enzyme